MKLNQEVLLSFIIPVYNVKDYLAQCLESVLNQIDDQCEIICVEDQSTDESYSILLEYKQQFPKMNIIRNAKNRGLSYSRNQGIKQAKGRFLVFLDSDDYMGPTFVEQIKASLEQTKVDIIAFNTCRFEDKGSKKEIITHLKAPVKSPDERMLGAEEAFKQLLKDSELMVAVWNKIYRRSFLLEKGITFMEGILHEDVPFCFKTLLQAESIIFLDQAFYYYRIREGSIMHGKHSENHIKSIFYGYLDSLEFWKRYIRDHKHDMNSYIEKYLENKYLHHMRIRMKSLGMPTLNFEDPIVQFQWEHFNIYTCADTYAFDKLADNQEIIIYGAGMVAQKVFLEAMKHSVPILGIAVSKAKVNERMYTYRVKEITKYIEYNEDALILVATSKKLYPEIEKYLIQLKFKHIMFIDALKTKDYEGEIC